MSYIFDALQRSETERSGIELDASDLPTELLQMSETAVATNETESTSAGLASVAKTSAVSDHSELPLNIDDSSRSFPAFVSWPVSLRPNIKLVTVTDKESLAAEKFRFLAVRLRQLQQRRPLKRVLVTSTIPEEGKSLTATNLACTLASRKQHRVLLIEGDMRRPVVKGQLGLREVPGLSEYLQGGSEVDETIYRLDALGIWVMTAGNSPEEPLELMQSTRLSRLLERLDRWFDWIVIDSPPVLPLADTSVWARFADGILLVTRQGVTDREQLKRGLETLEPSKLLGAIVNSSTNSSHSDYYQRYKTSAPQK